MQAYMRQTERDLATVLNEKAFSILMSATKMTRKADYNKMFSEIGPTSETKTADKIRVTRRKLKKGE